MIISLEIDSTISFDLEKCISILNSICTEIKFKKLKRRTVKQLSSEYIDLEQEYERIQKKFSKQKPDLCIYATEREYEDNFFWYCLDNVSVFSIAHWEHYTSLAKENGFFWGIAYIISDHLSSRELRHDESTGCLSDYLWNKTDIDRCMKTAHLCDKCHKVLEKSIKGDSEKTAIFSDMVSILDLIASTSRWGKSVFYSLENKTIGALNPSTFEDAVADYYRSIDAKVEQDVSLAGFQVDVVVTETTMSGEEIRSAIECKFYSGKVGNRIVNDFARIVATMKESGLIDRGTMVAYSGFSKDAKLAAKHSGIKLLHYKDIAAKHSEFLGSSSASVESTVETSESSLAKETPSTDVFVVMPFSAYLDDHFFFGIRGAVDSCGLNCERGDEMHFTGDIVQEIYNKIKNARIIIAEVTEHNANVYYELGFAHALQKPVILLTGDISKAPFDISGFNHIAYNNIKDLKTKLTDRLSAILGSC